MKVRDTKPIKDQAHASWMAHCEYVLKRAHGEKRAARTTFADYEKVISFDDYECDYLDDAYDAYCVSNGI